MQEALQATSTRTSEMTSVSVSAKLNSVVQMFLPKTRKDFMALTLAGSLSFSAVTGIAWWWSSEINNKKGVFWDSSYSTNIVPEGGFSTRRNNSTSAKDILLFLSGGSLTVALASGTGLAFTKEPKK